MRVIRNENAMISIIRQAALDTAEGITINYPAFISVEEHYEREKIREDERKKNKKNKLSSRQINKKAARVTKISTSDLKDNQPTLRLLLSAYRKPAHLYF